MYRLYTTSEDAEGFMFVLWLALTPNTEEETCFPPNLSAAAWSATTAAPNYVFSHFAKLPQRHILSRLTHTEHVQDHCAAKKQNKNKTDNAARHPIKDIFILIYVNVMLKVNYKWFIILLKAQHLLFIFLHHLTLQK